MHIFYWLDVALQCSFGTEIDMPPATADEIFMENHTSSDRTFDELAHLFHTKEIVRDQINSICIHSRALTAFDYTYIHHWELARTHTCDNYCALGAGNL